MVPMGCPYPQLGFAEKHKKKPKVSRSKYRGPLVYSSESED